MDFKKGGGRMKRVIFASVVLLLCALFFTGGVSAAEKFASVSMERIANGYLKAKEYTKNIDGKEAAYTAEINKKRDEVKQFQDKMNLLSDKGKEAKKAELESRFNDLQELVRQKQADFRKETFDKTMEISKDIKNTISDYAKKEGYTLVFDAAALAYQLESMDITEKIIDILNKGYKK
jgi:Skp family chaperone for outer membrane proteins